MLKTLYILGAAGSIGQQTLDIVRHYQDTYVIGGVSVGSDLALAQQIIDEFKPQIVCVRKEEHLAKLNTKAKLVHGDEGLVDVATFGESSNSILVNALVGASGLIPTVKAIEHQRTIALANKETLVMAGDIINALLKKHQVELYPIDSEHSAIWQCLQGERKEDIKKIIITASGGSFRDLSREELLFVTKEDALKHPNWNMGNKITIDSATMMNKGFEVIEAHHLFQLPYDQIETILHRQSIVHSFVEYQDLTIKAQLGTADMRIPILYALEYPRHRSYYGDALNLTKIGSLTFEPLDHERFPCLQFAYDAGKKGGVYPAILNAANEAAVSLFLAEKISFLQIEGIIAHELAKNYTIDPTLENILKINQEIHRRVLREYGGNKE